MSDIKIIRNDRGLDFRRIEQFLKMFQEKCQGKSRAFSRMEESVKAERKAEAFEHFNLTTDIETIKAIEAKIEALKARQKVYENRVRDYTQGQKDRYNSYDSIKEGSPIQEFINQGIEGINKKRDEVWALHQQLSNELWYAKDLEQAIEIMQAFEQKLDAIGLDGD